MSGNIAIQKVNCLYEASFADPITLKGQKYSVCTGEHRKAICADSNFALNNPKVCWGVVEMSMDVGKWAAKNTKERMNGRLPYPNSVPTLEAMGKGDGILTPMGSTICSRLDDNGNYNPYCKIASACSDVDRYNKATTVCPKYCLSSIEKSKECGLFNKCINNGGSDKQCVDFCNSKVLKYPCDAVRLQTFCANVDNMNNPLCVSYCERNPAVCKLNTKAYCLNNITDPKCKNFCAQKWTVNDSNSTTTSSLQSECDVKASEYCDQVRKELALRGYVYPDDYDNMPQDLKDKVNFCSCFLSPIGQYGQPACIDTRCQQLGWKTEGMLNILETGSCAPCVSIVNATGSYININGVTQQLQCSSSGNATYTSVKDTMRLSAKYIDKWRLLNSATNRYVQNIPSLESRINILLSDEIMFPSAEYNISELQYIMFIEALVSTNADPAYLPIPFTYGDNIILIETLLTTKSYIGVLKKIVSFGSKIPELLSDDGRKFYQRLIDFISLNANIYEKINNRISGTVLNNPSDSNNNITPPINNPPLIQPSDNSNNNITPPVNNPNDYYIPPLTPPTNNTNNTDNSNNSITPPVNNPPLTQPSDNSNNNITPPVNNPNDYYIPPLTQPPDNSNNNITPVTNKQPDVDLEKKTNAPKSSNMFYIIILLIFIVIVFLSSSSHVNGGNNMYKLAYK